MGVENFRDHLKYGLFAYLGKRTTLCINKNNSQHKRLVNHCTSKVIRVQITPYFWQLELMVKHGDEDFDWDYDDTDDDQNSQSNDHPSSGGLEAVQSIPHQSSDFVVLIVANEYKSIEQVNLGTQNQQISTHDEIDEDGNDIRGDDSDGCSGPGSNIMDSESDADDLDGFDQNRPGNVNLMVTEDDEDGWKDFEVMENPVRITKRGSILMETLPPTLPNNRKYAGARNIPATDDTKLSYFLNLLFDDSMTTY
eukprot:gene7782-10572_t